MARRLRWLSGLYLDSEADAQTWVGPAQEVDSAICLMSVQSSRLKLKGEQQTAHAYMFVNSRNVETFIAADVRSLQVEQEVLDIIDGPLIF